MKKIRFCKKNEFKSKKVYKDLKARYPDQKIKRKDCLGKCKTCKCSAFVEVDGKVKTFDSADELYATLNKKLKKSSKSKKKKKAV
ncbi:DUF1450 domain-containing protein [Desertibacillus haloalkaliphilus]|uniref:DUF1450 domain-containing protein n=1 Tax=Desertibacillus haloalkaliphilus TaxID=1328930 RepID=UPI001C26C62D|nr:DUF1450 domain-containing protein [Desertibacillus haloalkaliphilus]MBU8907582.1 DUF1450 domain-containing protein [Desertibacillus haloalkaliphilus]